MRLVYKNLVVWGELKESKKGENLLAEARTVVRDLKENGISVQDMETCVNDHFLDFLPEFVSGGIVSRTVQEIGTSSEYSSSSERRKSEQAETTYTLKKNCRSTLQTSTPLSMSPSWKAPLN